MGTPRGVKDDAEGRGGGGEAGTAVEAAAAAAKDRPAVFGIVRLLVDVDQSVRLPIGPRLLLPTPQHTCETRRDEDASAVVTSDASILLVLFGSVTVLFYSGLLFRIEFPFPKNGTDLDWN